MSRQIESILKNLLNGNLHSFARKEKKFLFVRPLNNYFEIDQVAFETLDKIKNGYPIEEKESKSFFEEWASLRIEKVKPKQRERVGRVLICDNSSVFSIRDLVNVAEEDVIAELHKLEIYVQINSEDVNQQEKFLNTLLFNVKGLWDEYRIKIQVVVKLPYHKLFDILDFLKKKKFDVIPQIEAEKVSNEVVNKLKQCGIGFIEVVKKDLNSQNLHSGINNLLKLDCQVTQENYPELLNELKENMDFSGEEEKFILPYFQNVANLFKFLTVSGLFQKEIITEEYSSTDKEKRTKCDTCWAKHACWYSSFYETFDDHPYKVNQNGLACELTYELLEELIYRINHSQNTLFEKGNKKQVFDLFEDGVVSYINP